MNPRPDFSGPVMRRAIEDEIERLIALLDFIDGNENLEPYLSDFDRKTLDEREEENEHGGDVLDEPHDGRDD